jgi:hypothetical protein
MLGGVGEKTTLELACLASELSWQASGQGGRGLTLDYTPGCRVERGAKAMQIAHTPVSRELLFSHS